MLTGKDFVAWDGKKFSAPDGSYVRANFGTLKAANAYVAAPVAPEYTELVEALTRMYGRIGMHDICRACFRGEKLPAIPKSPWFKTAGHHGNYGRGSGVGCCTPCGLQGREGCLSKPMGCALWMCTYTLQRFHHTWKFLRDIRTSLGGFSGFFNDPRPRPGDLSGKQRKLLRVLRHAVDAWEA